MRFVYVVAITVLVGFLAGCDDPLSVDPGEGDLPGSARAMVEGLEVYLMAPDTVATGDAFQVRIAVENPTDDAITVTTPSGCFVQPGILDREGERVPFDGSGIGCTAAITPHTFAAHSVEERTFDMQAAVRTDASTQPAEPGTYIVQAEVTTYESETYDRTTLTRELRVQE